MVVPAKNGINVLEEPHSTSFMIGHFEAIAQHIKRLHDANVNDSWHTLWFMKNNGQQIRAFENILAHHMNEHFYKFIKQHLQRELEQLHRQWINPNQATHEALRGRYYTTLKLYLMLRCPQKIDLDFAYEELERFVQRLQHEGLFTPLNKTCFSSSMIKPYLGYLKQCIKVHDEKTLEKDVMVKQARIDLDHPFLVKNLYAAIEYQLQRRLGNFEEASLFSDIGREFWQSHKPLSKLYSYQAYKEIVRTTFIKYSKTSQAYDWVINKPLTYLAQPLSMDIQPIKSQEESRRLLHELTILYFTNYLEHWRHYVESIHSVSFNSLDGLSKRMRVLWTPQSPFQSFFSLMHHNMDLKKMMRSQEYDVLPGVLRTRFQSLHAFSHSLILENSPLVNYLKHGQAIQQDIDRMVMGDYTAKKRALDVVHLLNGEGEDTSLFKMKLWIDQLVNPLEDRSDRLAFQRMLQLPLREVFRVMAIEVGEQLQQTWSYEVVSTFQMKLAPFFPFNTQGEDLSPIDFILFFKPNNGILAEFIHQLKPFVHEKHAIFRAKHWLGVGLPFKVGYLDQLSILHQLSLSVFSQNGDKTNLKYGVYPIPTPGIKEMLFASNGTYGTYQNGPQEWFEFTWSLEHVKVKESFIRVMRAHNGLQTLKEFNGYWSLFRLLHSASYIKDTPRGHLMEWRINQPKGTKSIRFIIAVRETFNPFKTLLEPFKPLPSHMMESLDV